MDAVELSEIASNIRARLTAEPSDALTLAHCAGVWLEPRIGAQPQLFGRRVVYDPSADHEQQVARFAVTVLLTAIGFADVDDLGPKQLDALVLQLIPQRVQGSHALSA